MPIRTSQRAHVATMLDITRALAVGLNRLPASKECFKAQSAAAVLERCLEELEGALK